MNYRTRRHKTHKLQDHAGAVTDAMVAYRWHAWSGQKVRVHEVLERGGLAFARCTVDGAPPGRSQELPLWMLDRATCDPMRGAEKPVASAAALAALRTLLTEALAWSASSGEGSQSGRIGSRDRQEGDRHAAIVTPSTEHATRTVSAENARPSPGTPSWASLPEPTRLALTGLVTRMLIAHVADGPLAPVGDGDDE